MASDKKDPLDLAQTYLNCLENQPLTGSKLEGFCQTIALILLDIAYTLREMRALFEALQADDEP